MKILQLCYKPPCPPVDGGTLAMNSVTQGLLAAGHEVKVLSVCSAKHPVHEEAMPAGYAERTRFESVYIDLGIHPLDAAVALLCGESYNVKRFYSKDFERRLVTILDAERFDVVHVESIFLAPYVEAIRRHSDARVVLRAHNVEHRIWQQTAAGTRRSLKRWYLKHLALALRSYELEQINHFDGVACITATDAETFRSEGCRKPLADIPFGINPEPMSHVDAEPMTLFHIGSMDWRPNEEGVRWFLKEVWPLVHNELPQVRLFLAGRKMPDDLLRLDAEGVQIVGEVPDAAYFMASKMINVVPLLSGSGIRVKIIEAMSLGKPVISTHVGAEGIRYTDGENLLTADTPQEFVAQVRRCMEDEALCRRVGDNAYRLVATEYSTEALTERLVDFYNKIVPPAL